MFIISVIIDVLLQMWAQGLEIFDLKQILLFQRVSEKYKVKDSNLGEG